MKLAVMLMLALAVSACCPPIVKPDTPQIRVEAAQLEKCADLPVLKDDAQFIDVIANYSQTSELYVKCARKQGNLAEIINKYNNYEQH